jgi:hypothetical protein
MARTLPPQLTAQERTERRDHKHGAILTFLASGEVYTVAEIAATVMQCSRPTAWRALTQLSQLAPHTDAMCLISREVGSKGLHYAASGFCVEGGS